MRFKVGQKVRKCVGDYRATGIVLSEFNLHLDLVDESGKPLEPAWRYNVRHEMAEGGYLTHVYSAKVLAPVDEW